MMIIVLVIVFSVAVALLIWAACWGAKHGVGPFDLMMEDEDGLWVCGENDTEWRLIR